MPFVITLLLFLWLAGICNKEENDKKKKAASYADEHPPVMLLEERFLDWYFYLRYRVTDVEDACIAAIERTERNMLKQGFRPSVCFHNGTGNVWEMSKIKKEALYNNGVPRPLKAIPIDPIYSTVAETIESNARKSIVENTFRWLPTMRDVESDVYSIRYSSNIYGEEQERYFEDAKRRLRGFHKLVESFGITSETLREESDNYDAENQRTTKVTDINDAYARWLKEQDAIDPNYEKTSAFESFDYFFDGSEDRPNSKGRSYDQNRYQ